MIFYTQVEGTPFKRMKGSVEEYNLHQNLATSDEGSPSRSVFPGQSMTPYNLEVIAENEGNFQVVENEGLPQAHFRVIHPSDSNNSKIVVSSQAEPVAFKIPKTLDDGVVWLDDYPSKDDPEADL
jgi:hypothetical protein